MSSKKTNSKVKTYNPKTRSKNRKRAIVAVIAVVLIAIVASVVVTQTGLLKANSPKSTPTPPPAATASPAPTSSSSSPYPSVTMLTSPSGEYSTSSTLILFITSKGDIVLQMRNDKPITTTNFVNLVKEGYYNGTIFQRVIADFMIQGGEGKTTQPTIENLETGDGNSNLNMTIAMANAGGTNTASTQFFINVADNSDLNSGYTVFGQVIYGQNTVMAISNSPVGYSSEYQADVLPTPTITLIGAVIMP